MTASGGPATPYLRAATLQPGGMLCTIAKMRKPRACLARPVKAN